MTDLKPCPMPIDGIEHNVGIVRIGAQYWCRCTCGVSGFVGTEKQAVTAWNTRTPDTDWQPIETAPRDGSRNLYYRPLAETSGDMRIAIKRAAPEDNVCWGSTIPDGVEGRNPTDGACHCSHWKPLDEPPKE